MRIDFEDLRAATPASVGDIPDWNLLCEWFPVLSALDQCPQDDVHHAEGDAGVHTRMVLEQLVGAPDWDEFDEQARFRLFWAAVFHDSGKPKTTAKVDGRWTSPRHSRVGAFIARENLRAVGIPFEAREEIAALIAAHQVPFHLTGREDMERRAIELSLLLRPRELLAHARADALGRICRDQDDLLMRVDLAQIAFEDLNAFDGPFQFANDESRVAYFSLTDRNPWYEAWEDECFEVTVMCGLPGSGKDTWIRNNRPDVPVVSLDDLRDELEVSATDNQGRVQQAALEAARSHLRARRPFVWNATNVTRDMRGRILKLIREYSDPGKDRSGGYRLPRIVMVYIEPPPGVLLSQNGARRDSVPPAEIVRLARKLDPPRPDEAHETIYVTPGLPKWSLAPAYSR